MIKGLWNDVVDDDEIDHPRETKNCWVITASRR